MDEGTKEGDRRPAEAVRAAGAQEGPVHAEGVSCGDIRHAGEEGHPGRKHASEHTPGPSHRLHSDLPPQKVRHAGPFEGLVYLYVCIIADRVRVFTQNFLKHQRKGNDTRNIIP